ncbi:nitric oxide synthase-interacting protein isoform X3 [Amia ocellicauda]|uniref:nitric oxide synthase-interacting protein isoform X3 n=1 Tax=Amia ocellicauda TaxID=2972642 RepID=UPI003464C49B
MNTGTHIRTTVRRGNEFRCYTTRGQKLLLRTRPEGYLYEREAILEYILHQKTEIAKKMKAYEKQKRAQSSEEKLLSRAPQDSRVQRFLKREGSIVSKPLNPFTTGEGGAQCSSEVDSKAGPSSAPLPSFWIPSLTPEAKPTTIKKPAKTVLCPMSGRPLKLSDLVSVRFTPLNASLNRVGLLTRQDRYVCAVTRDTLGNSVPCAVLRPSGSVVTMECVERLIRKDMTDPETGAKLRETDIIPLQRGGTGFSGSGVQLKAKESRPVMQV